MQLEISDSILIDFYYVTQSHKLFEYDVFKCSNTAFSGFKIFDISSNLEKLKNRLLWICDKLKS